MRSLWPVAAFFGVAKPLLCILCQLYDASCAAPWKGLHARSRVQPWRSLADRPAMLNRLPRQLPPLALILDDIGAPTPAAIAVALGAPERSVRRWIATGAAPRPAMLALFWLTRWGMSIVDCEAGRLADLHAALARSRLAEADELRAVLAKVLRLADFGAANDPHAAAPIDQPPSPRVRASQRPKAPRLGASRAHTRWRAR